MALRNNRDWIDFGCSEIYKSFGGVSALTGISFKFSRPEIIAIIGPNGAGKTTLFNIMSGFVRADTGQCFLGEKVINDLAPYEVSRLGIARTFQDLRLILHISAQENVLLARPHQQGERLLPALLGFPVKREATNNHNEAMRLLASVGLEEMANELAGELSYGQQKLLTLACCLATEANILLLDEPVAGIHPELITRMLNLFRRLNESGKLIIFIEHDISSVRDVADSVVVMDEGRIIAQGPPNEILERSDIMEAYIA
jgi:ABC-type branched-subunit amino acid transport system ATPase component